MRLTRSHTMRRGRKSGEHLMISDRSGFRYPSSEIVREWTGAYVAKHEEESRHPQEFVRGVVDDYSVRNPRPQQNFLFTLSTGNTATASSNLVTRDGDNLVTRDGDTLRSRGETFTASDDIVNVDLSDLDDVSFVVLNFSELTEGKDKLNIFTSEDNVTYTPLDIPFVDILRALTIGSDVRVPIGRRCRYVALRFQPLGTQIQSNFTLDTFDVLGSEGNE